jgi:hypothetical protein
VLTWPQVLAWRMRRQLLDPVGDVSTHDVVRRLCGVQTQVPSFAELAVRVRRERSRAGDVARALADGRLIKTWAMRGTLHLLTPEQGGAFLSLIAAGRSWETPAWERWCGLNAKGFDALRDAAREALDGKELSREELAGAITKRRGLKHVGELLLGSWGSLLKPIAWQGDLCFGPNRAGRATFQHPAHASARWKGLPEPEVAASAVIAAYFSAYGPGTIENFRSWISRGRISARQIRGWFDAMGHRLVEVRVDGERLLILAEDVDELMATKPTKAVRLLPGFDQYVLGVGTEDRHVVAAPRRRAVSLQSGWIAPLVVAGGAVRGTWQIDRDRVRVGWFKEAGRAPTDRIRAEVRRLSRIADRDLSAEVYLA